MIFISLHFQNLPALTAASQSRAAELDDLIEADKAMIDQDAADALKVRHRLNATSSSQTAEESSSCEADLSAARRDPKTLPPDVLVAALDILKKKKDEAVEKDDFDRAKKISLKMRELEKTIGATHHALHTNPVLRKQLLGSEGEKDDGLMRDLDELVAARNGGRGFLNTTFMNPFRVMRMLNQLGYSKTGSCGIIFCIFGLVVGIELLVLKVCLSASGVENMGEFVMTGKGSSLASMLGLGLGGMKEEL